MMTTQEFREAYRNGIPTKILSEFRLLCGTVLKMERFDPLIYFLKNHRTDRWNLQDCGDAFTLYESLTILQRRYFLLYQLEYRAKHYKKSTTAFGMYFILDKVIDIIFPFKEGRCCDVSDVLNRVNRRIKELEQELGYDAS